MSKKYYEKFIKIFTSKIIILANIKNLDLRSNYNIYAIYNNLLHIDRIYKLVIDPKIKANICYSLDIDIVFESFNKYYNLICTLYYDYKISPILYFYDLDSVEIKNAKTNKYISESYYFGYDAFILDNSEFIIPLITDTITKIKSIDIKPTFYVDIDIDFEFIEAISIST